MLAFAPQPCIVASVMERCTRELRDTARIRGIHLEFRTFESRESALAALYSGRWANVTPRALPHEGVADLAQYLGRSAAGPAGDEEDARTVTGAEAHEFRLAMAQAARPVSTTPGVATVPGSSASSRAEVKVEDSRVAAEFGSCNMSVSVDAARLQQVFYNIVMNAIRASTSGSTVLAFAYVVRSSPSDVQFCFGVQDNGHGMDAERAGAIGIEPLQSSLLSATSSYHGRAGLGLSFAKVIVAVRPNSRSRERYCNCASPRVSVCRQCTAGSCL